MEAEETDTISSKQPTSSNDMIEEPLLNEPAVTEQTPIVTATTDNNVQLKTKEPVKYFIDNGIQFKLDNGQLFKKVWQTVPIEPYMSDEGQQVFPEFRIINKETGKQINSTKYDVQQLVWEPLNLTNNSNEN
jgi:hypothetical protein